MGGKSADLATLLRSWAVGVRMIPYASEVGDRARIAASREDPTSTPSVTVIISTRNRGGLIAQTLETLMHVQYPGLQILVVDQSTDDTTRRIVAQLAGCDSRIRYEPTDTVGLSAGRNIGAGLSNSDIIAYTDDDCVVSDQWLPFIVEEFRNPRIAAVFGRLLPYGHQGRTGTEVAFKDSPGRVEYSSKTPPWHVGHGANMAFRRSALVAVGGFDPLLGAGGILQSGEDGDISYRLLAAGKRIVYSPQALVYHKHWRDWGARKATERAYGLGAGAQFAKYIRCGDRYGWRLLSTWVWQLGVRRLGAGLLKWSSLKVMYLGYCQLVYPWIGIWRSRQYEIDGARGTYVARPEHRSFCLAPTSTA